jgi:hypothetical protein
MTQGDMAGYLGTTPMTLRNWRRDRPNLYKIILQGLEVEDVKKTLRESLEKLESVGEENGKKKTVQD